MSKASYQHVIGESDYSSFKPLSEDDWDKREESIEETEQNPSFVENIMLVLLLYLLGFYVWGYLNHTAQG
jgi:hypothetical protein